jgi:putative Mg2+ transporter-C (MgtC) family protein
METLQNEIFAVPDLVQFVRVSVRLVAAVLLGALLGVEREREGKAAGLRTHMLVALGAALFIIAPAEGGMEIADLSRVFQGVATGIGFVGAGTILKLTERQEIRGLTTAASLWLTAAVGMAVGAGLLWIPVMGALLAYLILSVLGRFERRTEERSR